MKLSETEKAYLAGILDGEGAITIQKRKNNRGRKSRYALRVEITNTNQKVIQWIQNKISGGIRKRKNLNPKWKTRWCWTLSNRDIIHQFLKAVFLYLIIKEKHALLALQLRKGHSPFSKEERKFRENLYQKMKNLNK